ncbi:MAG TPA: hypothetical protein VL401_02910 [Alphaproteobacteria bacterium]|jgi:hypothetical protein|nr:hypothetical protein [Alphaproteobacteria bacterium]
MTKTKNDENIKASIFVVMWLISIFLNSIINDLFVQQVLSRDFWRIIYIFFTIYSLASIILLSWLFLWSFKYKLTIKTIIFLIIFLWIQFSFAEPINYIKDLVVGEQKFVGQCSATRAWHTIKGQGRWECRLNLPIPGEPFETKINDKMCDILTPYVKLVDKRETYESKCASETEVIYLKNTKVVFSANSTSN